MFSEDPVPTIPRLNHIQESVVVTGQALCFSLEEIQADVLELGIPRFCSARFESLNGSDSSIMAFMMVKGCLGLKSIWL